MLPKNLPPHGIYNLSAFGTLPENLNKISEFENADRRSRIGTRGQIYSKFDKSCLALMKVEFLYLVHIKSLARKKNERY